MLRHSKVLKSRGVQHKSKTPKQHIQAKHRVKRSTKPTSRSFSTTTHEPIAQPPPVDASPLNLRPELEPTVAPNNLPPNVDPLSARVTSSPPRQTIFGLMGWVHKNGGKLNPNVFYGSMNILRDKNSNDTGNWRGLALNDIEPGEVLAEVPLSLCLFPLERSYTVSKTNPHEVAMAMGMAPSPTTPNQTKNEFLPNGPQDENYYTGLQGLLTQIPPQQWQSRLGVRLLAERATENSFFQPYIDALPSHYPTFPIFFSQKTAQTLDYQPMLVSLNKQAQRLGQLAKQLTIPDSVREQKDSEAQIANLTPLQRSSLMVFGNQDVNIGDLAWAEASVSSRAFDLPLPNSKRGTGPDANQTSIDGIDALYSYQKCLVPLIDMLNHSFTPNCTLSFKYDGDRPFDPDDLECRSKVRAVLKSTHKIARGGELTISYFKRDDPDTIPKMPQEITAENQDVLADGIVKSDDINDLFVRSLARVPNVSSDGLQSTINNDCLLQHFGFIPGFNYQDDIVLNPDQSFFDTALEMAHDITVAHSYLAGKTSTSASQKIKLENHTTTPSTTSTTQQDPSSVPVPPHTQTSNGIKISAIPGEGESPKEITQAMFGEENTYDSALVKLLMPTTKHRIDDQIFLLHSLFQNTPTLSLNWGGPNETLLGVCRIVAAGAHWASQKGIRSEKPTAGAGGTADANLDENLSVESEILAKQESETQIAAAIESKAEKVFALAEKRGRVIQTMDGVFIPDDTELTGAQLFKGFSAGPIDEENETAAMLVLYHALVVASAGFKSGINKDVEGFYKAALTGQVGDATAHLYARSKKMLMAHSMKTLATRIGLDGEENKMHNWHKRLDGM